MPDTVNGGSLFVTYGEGRCGAIGRGLVRCQKMSVGGLPLLMTFQRSIRLSFAAAHRMKTGLVARSYVVSVAGSV